MANLKLEMPKDKDLQAKVIDAHTKKESRAQEMGLLGSLVGGGTEKPGNIASFVIVVSAIGIVGVLLWFPDTPSLTKKDAVTVFVGLITLALGYVFGRGSRAP